MQTNFVNVRDAAAMLGISPRAVLHRITRGAIRATKVGDGRTSAYVVTVAEIERVKDAASASAA